MLRIALPIPDEYPCSPPEKMATCWRLDDGPLPVALRGFAMFYSQRGALSGRPRIVWRTNSCSSAASCLTTVREDLLEEITRLAREGRFDYLLIESTGISESAPVADTFTYAVATMVTVIECMNFLVR